MCEERFKRYIGKDIVVRFYPDRCTGSGQCTTNLSKVFDTKCKPWVNVDGADAAEIKKIIDCCPSGALQYEKDDK